MKASPLIRRMIAVSLMALLTTACAQQQAMFVSTPPGAKVYIDGEEIGVTPIRYDYKTGQNGSHDVRIAKDGYDAVEFTVLTDEVDTASRNRWMVAGAVWSPLWIGTLFTKKLKDSYDFALRAEPPLLTARTGTQNTPTSGL